MHRCLFFALALAVGCSDARPPASGDPTGQHVVDSGTTAFACPANVPDAGARILTHQWPSGPDAETDLTIEAGAVVTACFVANTEVLWDVHRHSGNDVQYLQNGRGRQGEITFKSPSTGLSSFRWVAPPGSGGTGGLTVILVGSGKLEAFSP